MHITITDCYFSLATVANRNCQNIITHCEYTQFSIHQNRIRTPYSLSPGKTWQDKVKEIRTEMKNKKAFALVLYKMDEIACKLATLHWHGELEVMI